MILTFLCLSNTEWSPMKIRFLKVMSEVFASDFEWHLLHGHWFFSYNMNHNFDIHIFTILAALHIFRNLQQRLLNNIATQPLKDFVTATQIYQIRHYYLNKFYVTCFCSPVKINALLRNTSFQKPVWSNRSHYHQNPGLPRWSNNATNMCSSANKSVIHSKIVSNGQPPQHCRQLDLV